MWDADDRLPGEVLRVLDDVGDRVDGGDRRLALRERLHHLLRRPLADPLLDDLVELVDVLDPAHVVGEPRLLDQVRTTDDAHHALGDRLRAGREPEPLAVLREVGVARGGEGSAVAGSALHDAELVVEEGLRAEHPEERLIDREVDDLAPALAAVLAPPKRDHHGRAARERGDAVPERERGQCRRFVRPAVDVREAGDRLGERPEPRQVAVGTGLAEAGRAHDHQLRVDLVQDVRPEVPALERSRPEVLDQHVRIRDQALHELLPARVRERQRHAALVAADERPPERDAVLLPAHRAQTVPARMLDLDHVGAIVAEQGRDHRSGEERGAVDHAQALEGGRRRAPAAGCRVVAHLADRAVCASCSRSRCRARKYRG